MQLCICLTLYVGCVHMGANTYGNQKTANSTRARVTGDVLLQNNSSVHCENMFQSLLIIKKKQLAKS